MKQKHIRNIEDFKSPRNEWVKSYTIATPEIQTVYHTRSSVVWRSMTTRCANRDRWKDCEIKFTGYQEFTSWCQDQHGYMEREKSGSGKYWSLDKDLKVEGNRIYSEQFCLFVPSHINNLFNFRSSDNGLPVGVSAYKDVDLYQWYCSPSNTGLKSSGTAKTPEEAHKMWQWTKIKVIENTLLDSIYLGKDLTAVLEKRLDKLIHEYRNDIETKHYRFK